MADEIVRLSVSALSWDVRRREEEGAVLLERLDGGDHRSCELGEGHRGDC